MILDPRYYQVKFWLRAVATRQTAARVLYENRCFQDAMYLSFYSAECSLKAAVLANTKLADRPRLVEEAFRGAQAHRLDYWLGELQQRQVAVPNGTGLWSRTILRWSPWWRYESKAVEARVACDYLETV